ncbi:hypothetical protein PRZ48_001611 [Zasmidium cellare]|uniref:Glutaredoxin n=1 Tax=Zasmidium cellare TaxID=395010 RepID=A0ABR0F3F2_ZASCE|nr:hypothetical protein PRZ48_001611 [Zasmidium cellare]
MAAAVSLKELEDDPRLFLYTSLTAGSSHIITATSRMETILKANKIPFQAIDIATDEKARRLWQRRGGQRKLPGLVKEGYVIGDLAEVEEWNEFGELKENIGPVPANNAAPAGGQTGVNVAPPLSVNPTATQGTAKVSQAPVNKAPAPLLDETKAKPIALPGAAEIAARNKPTSPSTFEAINAETMTSSPEDKKQSIEQAKDKLDAPATTAGVDHLSAPASRLQSGTATPAQTEEASSDAPKTATEKHRGSDVVEAPSEEIKKIESENSLKEEDGEDGDTLAATRGVEGLKVGDETAKPQEQSAKEEADATKKVED